MPSVEACARCAEPNASLTYTSPSAAICLASSRSFFSSPLWKRVFSSISTSPGLSAFAIASTSGPTQSGAICTGLPSSLASASEAAFRLNSGSNPVPLGRPRWLIRTTDAPWSRTYWIVGSAALMRLSSVTTPSAIGTLKSTRMMTRLPLRSMSRTVFLFMVLLRGSRR